MQFPANALPHRPTLVQYVLNDKIKVSYEMCHFLADEHRCAESY